MNHRKSLQVLIDLCLGFLLLVACSAPAQPPAKPVSSTATPVPLVPTQKAAPAMILPTATLISPPTAQETNTTTVQSVRIVSHEGAVPSKLELWLEFDFMPGDILPGSQIESYINNGSLTLTLPGGESKTLEQVPHSPTDSELSTDVWLPEGTGIQMSPPPAGTLPLNGMSFENYTNSPSGPQIRIQIENLSDISANGLYQISWQSGSLRSNTVTFEWDGSGITVHEP